MPCCGDAIPRVDSGSRAQSSRRRRAFYAAAALAALRGHRSGEGGENAARAALTFATTSGDARALTLPWTAARRRDAVRVTRSRRSPRARERPTGVKAIQCSTSTPVCQSWAELPGCGRLRFGEHLVPRPLLVLQTLLLPIFVAHLRECGPRVGATRMRASGPAWTRARDQPIMSRLL